MIRRLTLLFIVLAALTITGADVKPASAAGEVVTGTCSSITLSGIAPVGEAVMVLVFRGATFLGTSFAPGGGSYSATVSFATQPTGTVLTIMANDPTTGYTFTTTFACGVSSSSNGSTLFFNPNDGRVDPRPGDRLAIYCNTTANPPTIGVYGIQNDSRGIFLATINVRDLLRVRRITRALGSLGRLDAIAVDANGNFYFAWTGGPFGATGQGIWAKSFRCVFPN
jgi:hypothetical protein